MVQQGSDELRTILAGVLLELGIEKVVCLADGDGYFDPVASGRGGCEVDGV